MMLFVSDINVLQSLFASSMLLDGSLIDAAMNAKCMNCIPVAAVPPLHGLFDRKSRRIRVTVWKSALTSGPLCDLKFRARGSRAGAPDNMVKSAAINPLRKSVE